LVCVGEALVVRVMDGVEVWLKPMVTVPVRVVEMVPESDDERVPETLAGPVTVGGVAEGEGLRVLVPVWLRERGLMVHEGLDVQEAECVGVGLGEEVNEKENVWVPVRVA